MSLRRTSLAIALLVVFASVGDAQPTTNQARVTPDFTVQVWGYIVADFSTRVSNYFELRRTLEVGLPALEVTNDPAEFMRAERALARRIRLARKGTEQEEIFTRAIAVEFRRILLLEMNASTWAVIMDDNPGEFSHRINGAYPKGKPHGTVPPNILAVLPSLPADIEYRFLGRHLILYDVRASVILDSIPYAIQFTD
jgi:hypothetical protein